MVVWKPLKAETFGVAIAPFTAQGAYQISFNTGDMFKIQEETKGWYKGTNLSTNEKGIFPASYVVLKKSFTSDSPDPVIRELRGVLREWSVLLKNYYKERKMSSYKKMKERLLLLYELNHKLSTVNEDIAEHLKQKVMEKIQEGRNALQLDMVVRTPSGEPATEKNTGIIQLYNLHQEMARDYTEKTAATIPVGPGAAAMIASSAVSQVVLSPTQQRAHNKQITGATGRDIARTYSSGVVSTHSTHSLLQLREARAKVLQKNLALITSSATIAPSPALVNQSQQHILMDWKIFLCVVGGEATELYFSLYNKATQRFTHEEYTVGLTAQGMPHDVNKIGNLKTIFTDISEKDLGELYLVCRMVRKGKMLPEGKEKGKHCYRRPFGCAVLPLPANLSAKELEVTISPIYAPVQEHFFPTMHELILKNAGTNKEIVPIPNSNGVVIGLTLLSGDLDTIMDQEPALKNVPVTSKLTFPEIILPGTKRNDFYLQLQSGEFSQGSKRSQKNVEVVIKVVDEEGAELKAALSLGCGEPPVTEFRSVVYYHLNTPKWFETVRVNVPEKLYTKVYLFFEIRHCSTKTSKEKSGFAVGFMKLCNEDGTVVEDRQHVLTLFKGKNEADVAYYIRAYEGKEKERLAARKGEQLVVQTTFCSTVLTQKPNMLQLLKWRDYKHDLPGVLNRFTFVDNKDIMKFLQESFDALFSILDEADTEELALLVYDCIVFVLGRVTDARSATHASSVLDMYIQRHFHSATAHRHLLNSLKHYLTQSSPALIQKSLKPLEYLFKFLIASRGRQQGISGDMGFKNSLKELCTVFNQLMQNPSPQLIGAQTLALKNFWYWFSVLDQVYDRKELAGLACEFLEAVPFSEHKKPLHMEKLLVLHALVQSPLFLYAESRCLLLPTIVRQLRLHMRSPDPEELLECVDILAAMLDLIETRLKHAGVDTPGLVGMLPSLLHAHQLLARDDSPVPARDAVACTVAILYIAKNDDFEYALSMLSTNVAAVERRGFLRDVFRVVDVLLGAATFPDNWFVVNMLQYHTAAKTLSIVCQCLRKRIGLLPAPDECELWADFFRLNIKYLNTRALALEAFSPAKQHLILQRYGDMRLGICTIFKDMWDTLGPHQALFTTALCGPFLELLLVDHKAIKQLAMALYFSLMEREFGEAGTFTKVEQQTIDAFDKISNGPAALGGFAEYFCKALEGKLAEARNATLKAKGAAFLSDMRLLLDLFAALRTLPAGAEYEDERTIATLQLMAYLKQTDRRDKYIKYVHMLAELHVAANNYTEAANTLLLHADLLAWDDTPLDDLPALGLPAESARRRKVRLYGRAIELFDAGKHWEGAIRLLCELQLQYERVVFDYPKLAEVLERQAAMFRKIVAEERFFAQYFRVAYYGRGFPPNLQNVAFIYRGVELERLDDFCARIRSKFPHAELLSYTEPPQPSLRDSDGQYLQIFAVSPSSMEEVEGRRREWPEAMPKLVRRYHEYNQVSVFSYSRPFQKEKQKSANPFADLWIRNYYYITQDAFPTIHRRAEIVKVVEKELTPIQNAVNGMHTKNKQLLEAIELYATAPEGTNVSPLTMLLKGVLMAFVAGGFKNYKDAFLTPEFLRANEHERPHVTALTEAMQKQVEILDRAVVIHKRLCPPQMADLQSELEHALELKKEEAAAIFKEVT